MKQKASISRNGSSRLRVFLFNMGVRRRSLSSHFGFLYAISRVSNLASSAIPTCDFLERLQYIPKHHLHI